MPSPSSGSPHVALHSSHPSGPTSRFTRRHLQLLRSFSTRTPLRVIAHIDLDAFYAQCEMVRLNVPRDQPLAVQQWESLIAVNYAARPFNITRIINAKEARKRCPQLVTPHVATFREGENGKWAYREDGDQDVQTDKVSLDPYRRESKKIQEVIKSALLEWAGKIDQRGCGEGKGRVQDLMPMVRIEKAGIDEVFVDLSALVYGTLVERYPMLQEWDETMDGDEPLPPPPTTALDWRGEDELVDLDIGEREEDDPDWDDIAMLAGAEIVRAVRRTIWERLKYTCSGGIARNKMMSKLGSACNKPNKQTIVRNRAIQQFLGGFKFTKIRMLGGKLGKHIASLFETEEVNGLLPVPLSQLKAKLDDDTGTWLYELIRGNEHSEVNPRTQIKSMLSTKSFRPGLDSSMQAEKWLRIFVADIFGRLVEEGVLEHKRRPKVITIHYRQGNHSKSRQLPIPTGKPIDEEFLFGQAKALLALILTDGRIWPCWNLSLTVSGFEEKATGNQSLEQFFVHRKNSEESSGQKTQNSEPVLKAGLLEPYKRRKIGESAAVSRPYFFGDPDCKNPSELADTNQEVGGHGLINEKATLGENMPEQIAEGVGGLSEMGVDTVTYPELTFSCARCAKSILEIDRDEHQDWHFAMDLDTQERGSQSTIPSREVPKKRQTRLAFG